VGVARRGAAAVVAATWPFLLPYLELREHGFGPRPREVAHYSPTSTATSRPRGTVVLGAIMRAFVKPEGELFPSVIPVLLALAGVGRARQNHVGGDAIARG